MRMERVTEDTVIQAGYVHSVSWQASHSSFCTPAFVEAHTPQAQADYLRREMAAGKQVYLLTEEEPIGIVSIGGSTIENLYVLPAWQGQGYGTRLLRFAMEQCRETPRLWILNTNTGARRLYERLGFLPTGETKPLREGLWELEMRHSPVAAIRQAEKRSHETAYAAHTLFRPGSWLAKPVKTVLELLPLFRGKQDFRALDLGCGVGRNSIPVAQAFPEGRVDCVDILPSAIEQLLGYAREYGVEDNLRGIVSGIDEFKIKPETYDLILAISALEHMDSRERFCEKIREIAAAIRPGGAVCLVVNTSVREWDPQTGEELLPQFEVCLSREELECLLRESFPGWRILKSTTVRQHYAIPRDTGPAELDTQVVTFAAQKER